MECYRCESNALPLAKLYPHERQQYAEIGIVLRKCINCGLEQNHVSDGEPLSPVEAAIQAPNADG